uniref:Uncharacterized protein n=1 Tax=Arundo donax TaxID=35708 RepID=A0A0A9BTE9_ARUDO
MLMKLPGVLLLRDACGAGPRLRLLV